MRFSVYFILIVVLLATSCKGTSKKLRKGNKPVSESVVSPVAAEPVTEQKMVIKEVEEKLVPIDNKLPDPHRYFVIIGSFRNPENARKYQGQILKQGFKSEILRNEEGLYRISVLATDVTDAAREEIRRIRRLYPEYADTWLLIQKK